MPKILYSRVIEEDPQQLEELEKYHRYSHLFQRVKMLRLLQSEECRNLGEAAQALGYSWRQCQRWFASYQQGGLEELFKSRVSERGPQELVTPEAFEDLQEAMRRRGRSQPSLRPTTSLENDTASSTLTPTASANSSGDAR
jgi:Helix-turn-helix domain